jgi:hypothetical protein
MYDELFGFVEGLLHTNIDSLLHIARRVFGAWANIEKSRFFESFVHVEK